MQRSPFRLIRVLGALFLAAVTVSVASAAAPISHAPPTAAPACASTKTKPSSAACAGAGPLAAAGTPTAFSVSLAASTPTLAPGGTTSLTATSNQDVGPTPWFIEIFDATAASPLVQCGVGTSCTTAVTLGGSGVRSYIAYISGLSTALPPTNLQATSATVFVSWITVSITASPTSLPAGGSTTVSAAASLDVGPTPYWIQIFDQSTGGLVARCGAGTRCSATVGQATPSQHSYVAVVSGFGDTLPPPDVRATSGTVAVAWVPAHVTVPNLVNADDGDVPFILNAAGLVLGSDREAVDCNHLGTVAHQSPAAGTSVAFGTAVSVTHGVLPTPPAECP